MENEHKINVEVNGCIRNIERQMKANGEQWKLPGNLQEKQSGKKEEIEKLTGKIKKKCR